MPNNHKNVKFVFGAQKKGGGSSLLVPNRRFGHNNHGSPNHEQWTWNKHKHKQLIHKQSISSKYHGALLNIHSCWILPQQDFQVMILKDKDYSRNSTSIIKIIIKMIAMIIIDQTITFISWTLQPGLQRDHKDPQVATRLSTLVSKIEIGVEILI